MQQPIKQTIQEPSININICLKLEEISGIDDYGIKSIITTKNGFIIPVNETKESLYDKIKDSKDTYNESYIAEFRNNYENHLEPT